MCSQKSRCDCTIRGEESFQIASCNDDFVVEILDEQVTRIARGFLNFHLLILDGWCILAIIGFRDWRKRRVWRWRTHLGSHNWTRCYGR
jgi:hypothetical protein